MNAFHKIEIRSKDGTSGSTEVLVDGERLRGVVRAEFAAEGGSAEGMITVRLEMYASELAIEAPLVERVFTSPQPEDA